ncbi:MAG: tyrosine--tRNA ligase [bacterium]|nr:tyrosine--tRNA ligase [bacterium]
MENVNKQLEIIKRGAVEIIAEEELKAKLERSIKTRTPLVIKAGFDPTAPDIHLGHTVLLRKLKHFSDLGHKVIFLIGDYTAMIGDPTGRSKTRKQLNEEEVKKNAETYRTQISRILDMNKIEIRFNSAWLSPLNLKDVIGLTAKQTVARLLERDDFMKRYKAGEDISMVEFMYPLLQAYDSVALKADVELGGTDQKFNLLLGRTIQKRYDQEGQVIMTMPLLEGLDGKDKMSKSLGNYISIRENSRDMFGKIMSLPDGLIFKYMELLTDVPLDKIGIYKDEMKKGKNPRDLKVILGKEIVAMYHDRAAAEKEEKNFEMLFSKKEIPDDLPVKDIQKILSAEGINPTAIAVTDVVVKEAGLKMSKSEQKKVIEQGGFSIDNEKITSPFAVITALAKECVIKFGKKTFIRNKPK